MQYEMNTAPFANDIKIRYSGIISPEKINFSQSLQEYFGHTYRVTHQVVP